MESIHDQGINDVGAKKRPKKVDQDVVDQIMDGLKDGQPRKTLELAKFCGFQTKQEINPTLYYMQKQRLLAKVYPKGSRTFLHLKLQVTTRSNP